MTKHIRIENADNSDFRVIVQVWDKDASDASDTLVHEERLEYPTAMSSTAVYLTGTRYVVVREVDNDAQPEPPAAA